MEERKNLCALIPIELHNQVTEAREQLGQPTMASTRTMAFQVSEELFQRIKAHLERETARAGKKLTQREFVLGLIEAALNEAEQTLTAEAPSGLCEATIPQDAPHPREEEPGAPSASV